MTLLNLFRAEWTKMSGHRWVTAFMIWIFPVGALAFVVVMSVLILIAPPMQDGEATGEMGLDQAQWTDRAIATWDFPNSLLGRLVMLGFTAVVFAGEYQWRTWKNIVPCRKRVAIILVKYAAVGAFVVVAFVLMSVILALGWGVMVALAGGSYGPRVTGAVLSEFAREYTQRAVLAFTLVVISASFVALAGMLTRSILGGVIVGIVVTYAEGLSVLPLALLAHLLDTPRIVYLYRLTPSYNVANINSWIKHGYAETEGETLKILGDFFNFTDDINFSAAVLLIWVILLVGLTLYLFENQDLT